MNQIATIPKSDLKELELNALLEITQAINNNLPEEALYRIYRFTLLANLKVKKLALYVKETDWDCKVYYGVPEDMTEIALPEDYHDIYETHLIGYSDDAFDEFDMVFPIMHKERTLAVVFIGEISDMEESVETNTTFLKALTNIIMVAIENKKLARQQLEQEIYRKELEIAKEVQQLLFPKELPHDKKLEIKAFYQPHHDVSGDYYDYIPISENKFIVCIADVSGKGVPAAIWMSNFQAALRTLIRQSDNLEYIVKELNYNVKGSGNRDMFITFFIASYDFDSKEIHYINSGHNPALLVTKNSCEELKTGSTILGVFEPLPFIDEGVVKDVSDFLLFCYTDGVTETFNDLKEEFGSERLIDIIRNHCDLELLDLQNNLISNLNDFRKNTPHNDDVTFMSCRVKGK
ncbi:MAG: PP2C family protein-serine/threonine phosphatase [Cyclobacteriaceae bacterium]